MSKRFGGYVNANGLRVHYQRTGGDGKPVVVFNHGALDSGTCWTPAVSALEDDFDCIMVDARDHGKNNMWGEKPL